LGRRCCDDTIWAQACGAHKGGNGSQRPNQGPPRHLTIPTYPDIFIIGDLALAVDEKGRQLPGVAQVAMQGGAYAAKAIRSRLEGKTNCRRFTISIRAIWPSSAAPRLSANIFGFPRFGVPAWLICSLFTDLHCGISKPGDRFHSVGIEYFTFSRGARLITGESATDPMDPQPDQEQAASANS